jgi:hypothetical protein
VAAEKVRWQHWRFPKTAQRRKVHPLDVGMSMLYARHGWQLMVRASAPNSVLYDSEGQPLT